MVAWVLDQLLAQGAFHLLGRVEAGSQAAGDRFAIVVAAVGLLGELGVGAVGSAAGAGVRCPRRRWSLPRK
jgi:hypothetical protein